MAPLTCVTDMSGKWKTVFVGLWMLVMCAGDGSGPRLSRKDVLLLLEDEDDPKCFTRTEHDFTCFFEKPDNQTYDFYYHAHGYEEKRCHVKVQRTEEETFLHICLFPASDVFMFTDTNLRVMQPGTNTTLYRRTVYVEDHVLLDPPGDVTLSHTGQAGQLLVTWRVQVEKNWEDQLCYELQYSSNRLGEESVQGTFHKLDYPPGQVVPVQMRVKRSIQENTGHWSHWSSPVAAMVPQSADDISLKCYTSDLQNVTCQWDGKAYGAAAAYNLFYKIEDRRSNDEGVWRECLADENSTDLSRFHGDKAGVLRVRLSTGSGPLNRTFYTEPFTLNSSIKTSPPESVKTTVQGGRLCLTWEAPLPALSAQLVYQVRYQPRRGGNHEAWMIVPSKGPETDKCLEVPAGSRYVIQVRARPQGNIYSGHWSDWSRGLTGETPSDIGAFLIPCVPVMMLILAVVFISLFSRYLSKLKEYLWPPVPNLDKVLQGFLTEINRQTWDPLFTAKSYEETPASVVEIMSEEGEAPGSVKPHGEFTCLLCPGRGSAAGEQGEVSPGLGLEASPDYVTLSADNVIPCQKANEYVCEQGTGECRGLCVMGEVLQVTGHCTCTSCFPSCSNTDILNHSRPLLAESTDRPVCLFNTFNHRPGYVNVVGTANNDS